MAQDHEYTDEECEKILGDLQELLDSSDLDARKRLIMLGKVIPLINQSFDVEVMEFLATTVAAVLATNPPHGKMHERVVAQLEALIASRTGSGLPPEISDDVMMMAVMRLATNYVTHVLDDIRDSDAPKLSATLLACWSDGFLYRGLLDAERRRVAKAN